MGVRGWGCEGGGGVRGEGVGVLGRGNGCVRGEGVGVRGGGGGCVRGEGWV